MEIVINNTVLYDAIASVYRAASTDEVPPGINSVLLKIKNKTLVTAATNGHMLAKWETEIDEEIDGVFEVNLKLDNVKDLVKMLKKDKKTDAPVIITDMSERDVQFRGQGFCITCGKTDGAFPAYEKIIPTYDDSVTSGPFAVNGYYLSIIYQCFKEHLGKEVALEFKVQDPYSPILITNESKSTLSVVLMPLRL